MNKSCKHWHAGLWNKSDSVCPYCERDQSRAELAAAQATIQQMREAAGKLDGIKSFLLGYETSEAVRRNDLQPTVSRWIDGVSSLYRMTDAEADRSCLDAMLAEARKEGMLEAADIGEDLYMNKTPDGHRYMATGNVIPSDIVRAIRQAAERSEK